MSLIKHQIWELYPGTETFEQFKDNLLEPLFLKEQVPKDIKEEATLAERILQFSYFEYEFIDIALTQAVFVFEKALKVKWEELHGIPPKRGTTFAELIDWFSAEKYFEVKNKRYPHLLRDIRNGKVHNTARSLGGILYIQAVYNIFYLINDLYECPVLRASRVEATDLLNTQLIKFTEQGAILTANNLRLIVYRASVVFLNNKCQPHQLCLLVSLIYEPDEGENGEITVPPHLTLTLDSWNFDGDSFSAKDSFTGESVTLTRIDNVENRNKFEMWYTKIRSLKLWPMFNFLTTEPIGKYFRKELRRFHES